MKKWKAKNWVPKTGFWLSSKESTYVTIMVGQDVEILKNKRWNQFKCNLYFKASGACKAKRGDATRNYAFVYV